MNSLLVLATILFLGCTCSSSGQLKSIPMTSLQKLIEKYRQVSVSKVLTLNLSNAILLLLLKLTFIGAMYFRSVFKNYNRIDEEYGNYRRSDRNSFSELEWVNGYLRVIENGDYNCIHNLVCSNPTKAKEYVSLTQHIISIYKSISKYLPYDPKYEVAANSMRDAISSQKINCKHKYTCKKPI